MAVKHCRDDLYEVSDPTDWLSTPLSGLAGVESALRCQICKEFYTTPMITSCGHTFCSVCIRRSLAVDGKCPACRASDQEIKLKNNVMVEDAVEAFQRARDCMLEYANRSIRDGESIKATKEQKRKRTIVMAEEGDEGPRKRTRSSTRRASSAAPQPVVVNSDEDDDEYFLEPAKAESSRRTRESSKDTGLVQCPICQGRMTELQIDRHIDQCNGIPPATRSVQSPMKPTATKPSISFPSSRKAPDRLPQLHYGMIKDNILKKKLGDLGLSANGSRAILEKRYTEWVTLVNANCDARNPRAKKDLLKDLEIWEKTQGSRALITNGSGNMIKEKDFDGAAWASRHENNFKDLIANAKRRQVRPGTPSLASEQPNASISAPASGDGKSSNPSTSNDVTGEPQITADEDDVNPSTRHFPPDTRMDQVEDVDHSPLLDGEILEGALESLPLTPSQLALQSTALEHMCLSGGNTLPPL